MVVKTARKPKVQAELPSRRLFTADEFERMDEAGVFGPEERLELLDGEIVCMSPIGSRHAARVTRVDKRFTSGLGDRALVRSQNPVRLADRSESHRFSLDSGMRPVSNGCTGEPGEVPDDELNAHLGNAGSRRCDRRQSVRTALGTLLPLIGTNGLPRRSLEKDSGA